MRRRGFTLVEILVALVVIGILATFAVNAYQGSVEASKERVCASNLKLLKTALDIYVMDHDAMPGSLSQIPHAYINRAYAKVMAGSEGFLTRVAEAVLRFDERGNAYASFMKDDLAQGDLKVMTCPADKTPPTAAGGTSYSLSIVLRGLTADQYKNLDGSQALIVDGESAEFSGAPAGNRRHGAHGAQYITFSGQVMNTGNGVSHNDSEIGGGVNTTSRVDD